MDKGQYDEQEENYGTENVPEQNPLPYKRTTSREQEESYDEYDNAQVDENGDAGQYEDDDESFNENNPDSSKKGKNGLRKSKRGRKRKIKGMDEGSTESDTEVFNYDKFVKKVSKKGTRVHMNVRMYA